MARVGAWGKGPSKSGGFSARAMEGRREGGREGGREGE